MNPATFPAQTHTFTLAPGLYKWSSNVLISTSVTRSGGPNDVWIFQLAGQINHASATSIILAGGALSRNIFGQAAGCSTCGSIMTRNGSCYRCMECGSTSGCS